MNRFTLLISLFFLSKLFISCDNESIEQKAKRIHESVLTVDTHTDTPMGFLDPEFDMSVRHDVNTTGSRIDFPRMKDGGMDAAFMAAFIGQGPCTPKARDRAKIKTIEIIDAIHRVLGENKENAQLALSADDAYKIEKEGKRAVYIGVENGYGLGKDINLVKDFYERGARYITLTHTKNNDIGDSSTDEEQFGGLSEFGRDVVKEMNELGMIIDVSHISDKAFNDIVEISKAPVIASHSCARAICDHPRNLSDELLLKLKANDGVIQMCILSDYVKASPPNPERDSALHELRVKYRFFKDLKDEELKEARKEWRALNIKYPRESATVSDAVDHIDHIVKVIGIDHVGIGTDFDGGGGLSDCRDVSEMGNITLELVRRGYTEEQIRKIWGGNFMRVFRAIEKLKSK